MCRMQDDAPDRRVRLYQCQHNTFHLNVGQTTLHLSPSELVLIGQAISKWAKQHPEWVDGLLADMHREGLFTEND